MTRPRSLDHWPRWTRSFPTAWTEDAITLPPRLARGTVDRQTVLRSDDAALDALWVDPMARVLALTSDFRTPVTAGGLRLTVPTASTRPADAYYLGRDDDGIYFAVVEADAPSGRTRLAYLREVGDQIDDRDGGLFVHAVALANWHATHKYCPRCGAKLVMTQGGHVLRCPVDDSTHFPRTDPAVIMLVTDPAGELGLLGRQPSWPPGRYSCLAGFAEPGESAEAAVVREVDEETGAKARDVRYIASQPWPFPSAMMLGFRALGDPKAPLLLGVDELDDAQWFPRDDIAAGKVLLPPPLSIARSLIDGWLGEHGQQVPVEAG